MYMGKVGRYLVFPISLPIKARLTVFPITSNRKKMSIFSHPSPNLLVCAQGSSRVILVAGVSNVPPDCDVHTICHCLVSLEVHPTSLPRAKPGIGNAIEAVGKGRPEAEMLVVKVLRACAGVRVSNLNCRAVPKGTARTAVEGILRR